MAIPRITVPLRLNLTYDYIAERNGQPLLLGDNVAFRFQRLGGDQLPVSLENASILMTITSVTGATLERSSTVPIVGTASKQIDIDPDQSIDTGTSGKGWYQVNFVPADEVALAPFVGINQYRIQIELEDDTVTTHLAGKLEVR